MPEGKHRGHCGGRFRQKAIDISNSFRAAFGFPPIEPHFEHNNVNSAKVISVGERPTFVRVTEAPKGWSGWTKGGDRIVISSVSDGTRPPASPHRGHHRHGAHRHNHHHGEPFVVRLQDAVLSLGPWEGRALAFVLGCGLGALLRMCWVLAIVLYRSFHGYDERDDYADVEVFDDERTPLSAPPAYIYPVDEKASLDAGRQSDSATDAVAKAQDSED